MNKNSLLLLGLLCLGAVFTACESTTTPPVVIAKFSDSTLFALSEGDFGKNNAELDGYSLKTDTLSKNIINPLGDVGNDIQIFGKRLYVVLENSDKILAINPDSVADRISIQFGAGSTPYNMAQASSSEVWVSEFHSQEIGIMNTVTNTLTSKVPIDTTLAYLSIYNGKAFLLTNTNKLEVIDIATKNVLANKYIGEYPAEIVIDSAHNSVVVLTYGDAFGAKTLSKIFWVDANTFAYTDSIAISASDFLNQLIPAGSKAYLTFGDRLDILDFGTHKISPFIQTPYYKGIFDPTANELVLGRGSFSAPGNVDILDAGTGIVKKTFSAGILPGHFVIYRKQ